MKFFKTIIKLLIIISVIIFFVKCLKINTTQPCSDPFCGCPPPVHGIDGYQSPSLFYMNPRVSCNLNKVAWIYMMGEGITISN